MTQLVAVLSGADKPDWDYGAPNLKKLTARVSPDGEWLVFMSERELTGYDNRDAVTGEPDEEVYQFHRATNHVVCVVRPLWCQTGRRVVQQTS